MQAKECGLIYKDQAFIPGERGNYPEFLETPRRTSDESGPAAATGSHQR